MRHRTHSLPAWPGGPEGELELCLWDNVPTIEDGRLRPMVVVCPGGSYAKLAEREGEAVALRFLAMGCHTAVLRYSVAPVRYPAALCQLARAVELIRTHAAEWYVDPEQILIQGSSAGGHLAACLGAFWDRGFPGTELRMDPERIRPDGLILSYPVIGMTGPLAHLRSVQGLLGDRAEALAEALSIEGQVTAGMPPVFLWHTYTDEKVPVEHSLRFVQALRAAGVSTEFHMYAVGEHGLGTAGPLTAKADGSRVQPECAGWLELAEHWIWSPARRCMDK